MPSFCMVHFRWIVRTYLVGWPVSTIQPSALADSTRELRPSAEIENHRLKQKTNAEVAGSCGGMNVEEDVACNISL
jgi:hypothetical protein